MSETHADLSSPNDKDGSICPKCGTKNPIARPIDRCPVCQLRAALTTDLPDVANLSDTADLSDVVNLSDIARGGGGAKSEGGDGAKSALW